MEAETANNKLPPVRLVRTWRLEGAQAFANVLGVTAQQVYEVLNGRRRSPRIEAALAAQGIACRPRPRTAVKKETTP